MADADRNEDTLEIASPPRFAMGERVVSRSVIRNDGTDDAKDIGEVLVHKCKVGFVRLIVT